MPAAILHLLGTAQPEGSGIARIVAALAAGLDPAKYHVHAWFLGPSGPLVEDLQAAGATARSIEWWRGARDPVGAYRFWRCLRHHDFAIVHQHSGARSVRGLIRFASDARLVVHLHGHVLEPGSPAGVPIAVRGADLIIAVSRAVALEIPSLKPVVVHAGVAPRKEGCAGHAEAGTATIVGAACRLVPLKGLLDLIRAVAVLSPEFPTLRLEIAGAGPERENLEREVERMGLAGQVRFLGWQRDLRATFRRWDVFAMPSLDEGLPIATLEAMAEGLPVVATSIGGLPELVEDGRTGYLVPPSDVQALIGCLRLLLRDPARRRTMGDEGLARIRSHFSVERMVAETSAIYDSLVAHPRVGTER